jgi:hypothetical protein
MGIAVSDIIPVEFLVSLQHRHELRDAPRLFKVRKKAFALGCSSSAVCKSAGTTAVLGASYARSHRPSAFAASTAFRLAVDPAVAERNIQLVGARDRESGTRELRSYDAEVRRPTTNWTGCHGNRQAAIGRPGAANGSARHWWCGNDRCI